MREIGIRELFWGKAKKNRAFFCSIWFRDHNNPRMSALLPRLGFLDAFLVRMPRARISKGLAFRIAHRTRGIWWRMVLSVAGRKYPVLFSNAPEQALYFPGFVVVDIDDPVYSDKEVKLLNLPNVVRYVVTSEEAARKYVELGVKKSAVVIPQGVDLSGWSPEISAALRPRLRTEEETVAVFHAAWLLTCADSGGDNPLYNVDLLLDMWQEIRTRVPNATLWLIGRCGPCLQRRVAKDQSIRLLGYILQRELPNYLANADVALYPRRISHVPRAVKTAEALALGLPVVGFDLPVLGDVRESGGGILVRDEREFIDATVRLLQDRSLRAELSARARSYGAQLDWDRLAVRYTTEAFAGLPIEV
jgi:glycosyltransferase involved in cell wall biosynthesis